MPTSERLLVAAFLVDTRLQSSPRGEVQTVSEAAIAAECQGLVHHLGDQAMCPDWDQPIRQGNDFVVCSAAKLPLSTSPQWIHEVYGFFLAVLTFAIVFGAFAANVIFGAMNSVPKAQIETAWA